MKRHGNLWSQITTFENLLLAAQKAQKGKRYRDNVLQFNDNIENELLKLQQELTNQTYQPGEYKTFEIVEPKKRMISAAPYRDRVVHHALCNIIIPIFENTFISDSYANRKGFGTHGAVKRFTHFLRNSRYILQCDIQKYFPSIDHDILKQKIRRKIKCQPTLWLIDNIIDHSNPQEPTLFYFENDDLLSPIQHRKGLPVGNLTSQFFANIYLNEFDHFVKEQLKIKKYVRYVDDFALFSDDKDFLYSARQQIEQQLATSRLKIHPIKSQLFDTRQGATFLGFRILQDRIRIKSESLRRAKRHLKYLKHQLTQEKITLEKAQQCAQSWIAHAEHANTWRLRQNLSNQFDFMP